MRRPVEMTLAVRCPPSFNYERVADALALSVPALRMALSETRHIQTPSPLRELHGFRSR
jgi:hypothetical protein